MPYPDSGALAEQAVATWLRSRGFLILATNARVGRLELDIIASINGVAVVVEVRTRGPNSWTSALGSVDWPKRLRIRRAGAALWRSLSRRYPELERMRFDLATVQWIRGEAHIEHFPAAF